MSVLAARRCVQHPAREAVARCPSCGHDYCRECVVEHAGRLLCASCLARESVIAAPPRARWVRLKNIATTVVCFFALWLGFYFMASLLKAIPPEFHEGTLWKGPD